MENPTEVLIPAECISATGGRVFHLIMVDGLGSCVRFETDYCGKAERIGYDFEKRGYIGTLFKRTKENGRDMVAIVRHFNKETV